MDVFRTGRRGRVVPLTEENYAAGNEPESTVRADAGRTSLVFRGMSGVRQSDPDLQPVQKD